MKQTKKPFRHFFLRSAAGFLAGALAVGAASTAAFALYETKCAESDAALNYRSLTNRLEEEDIPACTDMQLRSILAIYSCQTSGSSFDNGSYTDTAILLEDHVNDRLLDSSLLAWALIKGTPASLDQIPDTPELANADAGAYADGTLYFKKSFYSDDPEMLHAMHPYSKFGGYFDRTCNDIYAKGDTFVVGNGEVERLSPVLDIKEYHASFDYTPSDPEHYTHFCRKQRLAPPTNPAGNPEDVINVDVLFTVVIGSEENSDALAEVHRMHDQNTDIYNGYQLPNVKGGTCIAMQSISEARAEPAYTGYYLAYYHFWAQWHRYLMIFYIGLLFLSLLLAFLTAKIKYQTYSKQYALNAYRRKLTSALAHDLKTPLAAISGYAENLLESTHAEKHAHYANEIMQTTAHMDHIIADVLALAKLEDAQTVKTEPMDLNAVAKDTFARMQDEMDARAITVQFSGTYKCEANPRMMTRAIENLAANAVRYTPESGCIDVIGQDRFFRISNDADTEQIADAEALCEPFVKGNAARGGESGSGLGLAIVKQIAEIHHLQFTVKTENGKFIAELKPMK